MSVGVLGAVAAPYVGCRLGLAASLTVASPNNQLPMPWDTEIYDTDGLGDVAGNRIVVDRAGRWRIRTSVMITTNNNAANVATASVLVNGAAPPGEGQQRNDTRPAGAAVTTVLPLEAEVTAVLAAGDAITSTATSTQAAANITFNGGVQSLASFLEATFVGT